MKKAAIVKGFRYGGKAFPVSKKPVEMEDKVYQFALDNGCLEVKEAAAKVEEKTPAATNKK